MPRRKGTIIFCCVKHPSAYGLIKSSWCFSSTPFLVHEQLKFHQVFLRFVSLPSGRRFGGRRRLRLSWVFRRGRCHLRFHEMWFRASLLRATRFEGGYGRSWQVFLNYRRLFNNVIFVFSLSLSLIIFLIFHWHCIFFCAELLTFRNDLFLPVSLFFSFLGSLKNLRVCNFWMRWKER